MKINYEKISDYLKPLLKLKDRKQKNIGKYGLVRLNYIRQNDNILYQELLMSGTLNSYLYDLNNRCIERMNYYINHLKLQENLTEELKQKDQMEWVRRMNNIKNRAEELAISECIYE